MVSFALLFFIVAGVVLPNTTLAFSINDEGFKCGTALSKEQKMKAQDAAAKAAENPDGSSSTFWAMYYAVKATFSEQASNIYNNGFDVVECIKFGFAYMLAGIGSLIAITGETFNKVCGAIFKYVLENMIQDQTGRWAITRDSGTGGPGIVFLQGWTITKQWANMLIILGFLGVALAFVLNLEQYKKHLIPILLTALLINFSVVFVGLFIDASNIVMQSFIGSTEVATNLQYEINSNWNNSLYSFPVNNFSNAITYFALSLIFGLIYTLIGATLFMLSVIFVERYVILAILFILSPLAFVALSFPLSQGKQWFGKWWQHFIKWCFIGVIGAFFLNLASLILKAFNNQFSNIPVGGVLDADKIANSLSAVFFYLLVVILFLLVGVYLTFKASGWASALVIGGAMATGTALLSAGGKIANRATGSMATRAWTDTKERLSGLGESIGVRPVGSTALMRQKRRALTDGEKAEIDRMTPDQLRRTATSTLPAMSPSARRIRAAAIEKSFEKGLLNNLPQEEQENLARYAIRTNHSHADKIIKANPSLSHLDESKLGEIRLRNPRRPDETLHAHQDRIETMARKEAYARMPEDKELLKLNDREKINRIITSAGGIDPTTGRLRGNVDSQGAQLIESMAEKGTLGKLSKEIENLSTAAGHPISGIAELSRQMNNMADEFGSTVFKDAKAKDPHFADRDNEAIEERAQTIVRSAGVPIALARTQAQQELSEEAHGRISAYQMAADLDESVIDEDFVLNKGITSEKISKAGANERMSSNKKDKLRATLGRIRKEESTARAAGDITLADELDKKALAIIAII